jgi:hypothetical protein
MDYISLHVSSMQQHTQQIRSFWYQGSCHEKWQDSARKQSRFMELYYTKYYEDSQINEDEMGGGI